MKLPISNLVSCAKIDDAPYQVVDFFRDKLLTDRINKILSLCNEMKNTLPDHASR